ncbi:hypothetical protein [Andreprevotia chitinilytica]|uniref:hypothetical protein n=1 Tax=Andreprevotia chitinilytica TaxID=396808 RepID=UPI0005516316|nr:hypothetical protein [Andreprevotia chitinilytica]
MLVTTPSAEALRAYLIGAAQQGNVAEQMSCLCQMGVQNAFPQLAQALANANLPAARRIYPALIRKLARAIQSGQVTPSADDALLLDLLGQVEQALQLGEQEMAIRLFVQLQATLSEVRQRHAHTPKRRGATVRPAVVVASGSVASTDEPAVASGHIDVRA